MIIPYKELSPEALQGLIEDFVTRDGTDYGEQEVSLQTKVDQIKRQLAAGNAFISFDPDLESFQIVSRDSLTHHDASAFLENESL